MCGDERDGPETHVHHVVELYKARIFAALDGMSIDDIRQLVAEIEAKFSNPSEPAG